MNDSSNSGSNNIFQFTKRPFDASNDNSDNHSSESEVIHTYSQRNKRAYASLNNDECDNSNDDSLDLGKRRIRMRSNNCIDSAQEDSIDSDEGNKKLPAKISQNNKEMNDTKLNKNYQGSMFDYMRIVTKRNKRQPITKSTTTSKKMLIRHRNLMIIELIE